MSWLFEYELFIADILRSEKVEIFSILSNFFKNVSFEKSSDILIFKGQVLIKLLTGIYKFLKIKINFIITVSPI